jgi:hypothetical protein
VTTLHLFGQDTHDVSLNSFIHAYPVVTNGRYEAAPDLRVSMLSQYRYHQVYE